MSAPQVVSPQDLQRLLARYGAQPRAQESTPKAHIYWSPLANKFVLVYRHKTLDAYYVELHDTCPCGGVLQERGLV